MLLAIGASTFDIKVATHLRQPCSFRWARFADDVHGTVNEVDR
jgi:hypothetical protein